MKISQIEIIHQRKTGVKDLDAISYLWIRIHTDEGITGLGEAYPLGEAELGVIRSVFAPLLFGRNPLDIEGLWQDMFREVSWHVWGGAEMRALSGLDIALWDLYGKVVGQPLYQVLGGKTRNESRVYNTCYDPRYDFNNVEQAEAAVWAKDLLQHEITTMKIWPFDEIALKNRGQYITRTEMEQGLRPVQQIRDALGEDMEIAMEFHGYWNVPSAIKIAQALEPYQVLWLEDLLPHDNLKAYAMLTSHITQPICLSERLMTRFQYRDVIEQGLAQFIMPDICWCGGLTEARKIAAYADTYYLPVALHNCAGPVLHLASIHLAAHIPNLFLLESVQYHYQEKYAQMVTDARPVCNGVLTPPTLPGLGIDLKPEFIERPEIVIEVLKE